MLERFASLSAFDYIYAALLAFAITYMIRKISGLRKVMKEDELKLNMSNVDKRSVMERCTKMFPIDSVSFGGQIFTKGMKVRITTMQQKVFQGEFIGKNDLGIICILTNEHVIAHELKKITDMVYVDDIK